MKIINLKTNKIMIKNDFLNTNKGRGSGEVTSSPKK